jgi:hypothetical protein
MNSWIVWLVFAVACVVLVFIGYHFAVRTLRFVALAFAATVVVFVTVYGVTRPVQAPADLVHSFTRGVDELSAAFIQPLLPGHHIPVPGQIGWLVIIAALVFGYRELEVWAMRWQPPTVDMSALGGSGPATQPSGVPGGPDEDVANRYHRDRLMAELRFRLPAVEVRAPAILPGGTAVYGLASIAENSGATGSGLAGAILRFVGMLWPNPRRYQVRVWVEPCDGRKPTAVNRRVTVDLEDPRTGGSIATKTLVARELDEAASVVAAFVAQQIFHEDPTTPAWCVGSFDGDGLAVMLIAGQQRVFPRSSRDVRRCRGEQIEILERCSLAAGVARYELAHLYDLEGDHVKALRLHARNRKEYPRFYRSRYRLGMSLEMIASPEFDILEEKVAGVLHESLDILDQCGTTKGAAAIYQDIARERQSPDKEQLRKLRKAMLGASQQELRECRRRLTLWRVTWEAFCHRDERAILKNYRRLRDRQRFHDGALVAELLVTVRRSLNERARVATYRDRHRIKRALHITAAIAGDSAAIKALLKGPEEFAPESLKWEWHPDKHAEGTRWLPRQPRTPSWQAAYNTACLYAAMSYTCRHSESKDAIARQAVASLKRAINDRDCELERPSDWISTDPDFCYLRSSSKDFQDFLRERKRSDYPQQTPRWRPGLNGEAARIVNFSFKPAISRISNGRIHSRRTRLSILRTVGS